MLKPANNHGVGYHLATERELSDFLKSVEKRAFKRSLFHVRDEEAALDIVQDSMMKLAEHYGDKPIAELPMLFQRILSNSTLDWFRRQKTRNALFTNMSSFEGPDDEGGDFDLLEIYNAQNGETEQSAEEHTNRQQTLALIEKEIQVLPARQREAFLMRYWEEMDIAETAAAMGCSEGSVKTHCFRAIQTLTLRHDQAPDEAAAPAPTSSPLPFIAASILLAAFAVAGISASHQASRIYGSAPSDLVSVSGNTRTVTPRNEGPGWEDLDGRPASHAGPAARAMAMADSAAKGTAGMMIADSYDDFSPEEQLRIGEHMKKGQVQPG
ncbi:hypothetical protein FQA39_LY19060 [Lamprigera yunnana]|nr:hypothetical protein FQA39_LY19060 [Lamprigera yunnana]